MSQPFALVSSTDSSQLNQIPEVISRQIHELWLRISAKHVAGLVVLGIAAPILKSIKNQYWPLVSKNNLPATKMGCPFFGLNSLFLDKGISEFARQILGHHDEQAATYYYLFWQPSVMISYKTWAKYVKKYEWDAELQQGGGSNVIPLLGPDSVVNQNAGKGPLGIHHRKLRKKIDAAVSQVRCMELAPLIRANIKDLLQQCADETGRDGCSSFMIKSARMSMSINMIPVFGNSLKGDYQKIFVECQTDFFAGVIAVPIEFFGLTTYGRAMKARRDLIKIIDSCINDPNRDPKCLIAFLLEENKYGPAFNIHEIRATVLTMILASKSTLEQSLTNVFVDVATHRDWAEKIAADKSPFTSMADYSVARCVALETLRRFPQLPNLNRVHPTKSISLGELGTIPKGALISVALGVHMADKITNPHEYNPGRWADNNYARENLFSFGEHSPHRCPGQHMALLVMQLFVKELVTNWEYECIDPVLEWNISSHLDPAYHGLKVKVWRKEEDSA